MKELVLTFDYELFGDGAGDLFTDVINPTNQLLILCERFNIRATLFFEAIEYIRLKEEWSSGNFMGYDNDPLRAMENQIQDAAKMGHDIQLHVHPQWVSAEYRDSRWEVDFHNWRLNDFHLEDGYGVKELLSDAKNELEQLIRPVLPDYRCIALRAGAYSIVPSSQVYTAMQDLGLKIDSSVYPGGYENGSLSKYDYRNVPIDLDYWWADETDIRKASVSRKDILEFPVFALPARRWKKMLTPLKILSILSGNKSSLSSVVQEKIKKTSPLQKIQYLCEKEAFTWDVCMFSKSLHKAFFNYIETRLATPRNTFVLIGHPKSLQNPKAFKSFIDLAKSRDQKYVFKTLSQKYNEIC